jgi:hypothetical protein
MFLITLELSEWDKPKTLWIIAMGLVDQVISNTGFESTCSTSGESYRFSPCGVMDRNSTGETPSALCPPQEAGFTLNQE